MCCHTPRQAAKRAPACGTAVPIKRAPAVTLPLQLPWLLLLLSTSATSTPKGRGQTEPWPRPHLCPFSKEWN